MLAFVPLHVTTFTIWRQSTSDPQTTYWKPHTVYIYLFVYKFACIIKWVFSNQEVAQTQLWNLNAGMVLRVRCKSPWYGVKSQM
jgi:hypothetical protein